MINNNDLDALKKQLNDVFIIEEASRVEESSLPEITEEEENKLTLLKSSSDKQRNSDLKLVSNQV